MNQNQDLEYLRLLAIFHFVLAGLTALVACFPIIHLSIGLSMLTGGMPDLPSDPMFSLFPIMFTVIPAAIILGGWTWAIVQAVAGYCLLNRQAYMFCMVAAGINCAFAPLGTVLGVFTILVLLRPTVKTIFGQTATAMP